MTLLATGLGFVGTAAAADAPTCGDVTYAGSGTEGDPYQVENVTQLQCINGDHGDAGSRSDALAANYTLVSDVDASETSSWNDGKGFDPVGDSSTSFTGSFDGNGHEVTNLTIDRPSESDVGIFGVIGTGSTTATVENLTLTGLTVTADDTAGGLVGSSRNGSVTQTSVSGTVDGGNWVGGVVGVVDNGIEIRNTTVAGDVNGNNTIGGMVGSNSDSNLTVVDSASTAAVTGNSSVGGMVGFINYGYSVRIERSFTAGSVSGTTDVGGLWGDRYSGTPTISSSYWDVAATGQDSPNGVSAPSNATGLTTAEMTGMNASRNMGNLSFYDAWVPTKGDYPDPASLAGTDGTTEAAFDRYFAGDGTETNPYKIETAPELQAMNDSLAANYALASDVDAAETENWNGGKGFDPVGPDTTTPFEGSFDGRGHTISNVTVNRSSSDRVGLFGFVPETGTVTNVSVSSVDVDGGDNVGGLAGRVYKGTVRNVSVSGTVNGSSKVGGLAGNLYNGSATESSSTATVSGDDNLGGLVGWVDDGNMSAVNASGAVHGRTTGQSRKNVGGLVGQYSGGTIHNASASGDVSGPFNVGGLIGKMDAPTNASNVSAVGDVDAGASGGGLVGSSSGTIRAAFAAGAVTGSKTGGLVGNNSDRGSITDAYWDTKSTGASAATGENHGSVNATGLTTDEMTGMNTTRNMGNLSFYEAWVPTKGGYPEPASLAGTDGTTEAAFDRYFAGDGSESNPYEIETAPELQAMKDRSGAHYELDTDIDASETSSWNSDAGFVPVGDLTTKFTGTFDGQGHTITGLTVNRSSVSNVGLFGYTDGATVSNVTLSGVDVTGNGDVGSVVGYVNGGSVRSVSASGSVNGASGVGGLVGYFDGSTITNSTASVATTSKSVMDSEVGGIVGYIYEGDVSNVRASGSVSGAGDKVGGLVGEYNIGTLSNATASGTVDGVDRVGGLVGAGSGSITVRTSSATGDVNGDTYVGGLLGENSGTVEDSFSTGHVSGTDTVGGLVGLNPGGTVADSFSTGAVSGTNYLGGLVGFFDGGTITDTYWRNTTSNPDTAFGDGSGDATGLTTAEMTGMNATRNMGNLSFYDAWVPTKGDYPEPASLAGTDGTTEAAFDRYFAGDGTESNPYAITNAPELQVMNDRLGPHYELDTDVDASGTESWNDGKGFEPVGDDTSSFEGSFDGQGHTITGLTINRSSESYVGLFGYAESATLSNVTLSDVDITGNRRVGSVVGYVDGGSVRNVSASGSVNGTNKVGGLVGNFYSGDVSNVRASGDVSGTDDMVGGLVGEYSGTLSNATATGNVSGNNVVGGLVGGGTNSMTVRNSSATGDVSGSSKAGGLVGWNQGKVGNSLSTGAVSGTDPDTVGGLVGDNEGSVTDAYWRNTTSTPDTAVGSGSGDATGLTTAEMTGAGAAKNMTNLTFEDPWVTTEGYPVLQAHVTGLTFDLGTTSLTEGDTTDATVTLSLLGGRTESVTTVANYTTTDAGVADVEAGTLTAAGSGSATITADHAGANDSVGVDVSARNTGGGGGGSDAPSADRVTVEADPTAENGVSVATASVSASAGSTVRVQLGADDEPGGGDGAGGSSSETAPATVETLDIEFADDGDDAEGEVSVRQTASPPAPDAPEFDVDSVDPAGYLRVETDIDNEQIERAAIGFRLRPDALEAGAADAESVVVYHYDEETGAWDALPTEVVEAGGDAVRFTAVTPGFSDFVIGVEGRQPADDQRAETATSSEPGTPTATGDTDEDVTRSGQAASTTESGQTNEPNTTDRWLFPLVVVAVAAGVVVVLRRRSGGD